MTSFAKVYLHPGYHAADYPGARPIHLELLFSAPDGRILGAHAVELEGVQKRVDVMATAIQFNGTLHDLAEAEWCHAPQLGAAKDPVNLAGTLAENVLNGDMPVADRQEIDRLDQLLLDVREPGEFAAGHVPNAINLPLSQIRDRYAELPEHVDIWIYCGVESGPTAPGGSSRRTGAEHGLCPAGMRPAWRSGSRPDIRAMTSCHERHVRRGYTA